MPADHRRVKPGRLPPALLAALALLGGAAFAAEPSGGKLEPDAQGRARVTWTGAVVSGTAAASADQGESCFGLNKQPDPASGCDFFSLDVSVPQDFYKGSRGGVDVTVSDFDAADVDLYVYRRQADGQRGDFVQGDGTPLPGAAEHVSVANAEGAYYVVVVPFTVVARQGYAGVAELVSSKRTSALEQNRAAPPGFANQRASRDRYTSHSEPTIAMDPLDHRHLMAASKMYENNAKYLFKVGAYESVDGGRSWTDLDHLPGYCETPAQCDPSDAEHYRTTSDPSLAFDDEGNAYANVLDAPGGTNAFTGFNMTVHIKPAGQPFSGPITVHDNRNTPITRDLLLDDKNWIAADNVTDVEGGPNTPRDGKIGTLYICWSFDSSTVAPVQQIVLMRSLNAGRTWGGLSPGDNTPLQLSQKGAISGIGCHIAIGPKGEVYVTWYDNQLQTLMQARSSNRGASFTPAYPIGTISGVDDAFPGQAFRNLSIPSTGIDRQGNLYVAVASRDAKGSPVSEGALRLGRMLKDGSLKAKDVRRLITGLSGGVKENYAQPKRQAQGEGDQPGSLADIVLYRSADGGDSWTGPVRVNQDPAGLDADQFQPWLAVTDKGQVNVSYFDRRNDPSNFFIDTYLSRSNDGGKTFTDVRVSKQMWDPSVNPPVSPSGEFIGDYQGLVADDRVAIPFWNDTQLDNLPKDSKEHSPWQEVFSARVPNGPASFIQRPGDGTGLKAGPRLLTLKGRAIAAGGGKLRRMTVALRLRRGRRCLFYSPRRRRLVGRACRKPLYFKLAGTSSWRRRVPRAALAAGSYTLLARAIDDAGRAERPGERGRNLVRFTVR